MSNFEELLALELCPACLDGQCDFCLHGWPADPDCPGGCHLVTSTESPLCCPRCRATTVRVRVDTAARVVGAGQVVEVEECGSCGWSRQIR